MASCANRACRHFRGRYRARLYLDWRKRLVWQVLRASDYENTIGMQAPALYNAMKRAADGLQYPATAEFNGISAAFEIEGVPAFTAAGDRGRTKGRNAGKKEELR